jgi:hypothetical protein
MPEPHVIAKKIYDFVWNEAVRRFRNRDKYSDEEMLYKIEEMVRGVGRKWAEDRVFPNLEDASVTGGLIERAVAVEKEHTDSDTIAANIALDHIEEFEDYYDFLELMEKLMEKGVPIQDVRLALYRGGLPVDLR